MHAPGESMGSLFRVMNFCQGLTAKAHKCYIFTPFHYSLLELILKNYPDQFMTANGVVAKAQPITTLPLLLNNYLFTIKLKFMNTAEQQS